PLLSIFPEEISSWDPHSAPFVLELGGFFENVLKRNLAQPYRLLPGLVSLPLPEVRTGMSTLASLRAKGSGRLLSSPILAAPPQLVPSASGRPGASGSCACPRRLLSHYGSL